VKHWSSRFALRTRRAGEPLAARWTSSISSWRSS